MHHAFYHNQDILFWFEKLRVVSHLKAIKYWKKIHVYQIKYDTCTKNSTIIYYIFTFQTKTKKHNHLGVLQFFLFYGLKWNVVFAF